MTKGEIWISDLPAKGGHVQRGYRPAVILAETTKDLVMIIPITSALAATRFPYTMAVFHTQDNGLDQPSVLLLYQLGALDKRFLHRKIGLLDAATMQRVNDQLKTMLRIT